MITKEIKEMVRFFDQLILSKVPVCAFYMAVKDHKKRHGKVFRILPYR